MQQTHNIVNIKMKVSITPQFMVLTAQITHFSRRKNRKRWKK